MKQLLTLKPRNIVRTWLGVWGLYALLTYGASFFLPHTGSVAHAVGLLIGLLTWAGTVLTIVVLTLYYLGRVTDSKFNPRWILYACIGAWAAYLLLIGSASVPFLSLLLSSHYGVIYFMMMFIQTASFLTLPAVAIALLGIGKPIRKEKMREPANAVLLQVLASVVIAVLSIGAYAAIRTLWTPADHGKFVYNNLANGLGCSAIVLITILSYLQRDVYWLNRGRVSGLDERQIKERQEVFETSYKIGAILVFAAFCAVFIHRHGLLLAVQHDSETPGNILWPFANLVLALFALPLLVATYKMRRPATEKTGKSR